MKKIFSSLICLLMVVGVSHAAGQDEGFELRGLYNHYVPSDDKFDNGNGFEGGVIIWGDKEFGLGFSGGSETWEVYERRFINGVYVDAGGDVDINTAGMNVHFRPGIEYERLLATWSFGLRYLTLDPTIVVNEREGLSLESERIASYTLKDDEAITGKLVFDLGFLLTQSVYLFGGVGYQFDISKANLKADGAVFNEGVLSGYEAGDLSLGGLHFNGGIGLRF